MNAHPAKRIGFAVVCSLTAFITISAHERLVGILHPLAFAPLVAMVFVAMLYAQVRVLDLWKGRPHAVVRAVLAQPLIPLAVFLLGGFTDIAIYRYLVTQRGIDVSHAIASDALAFAAFFGVIGALLILARDGIASLRTRPADSPR